MESIILTVSIISGVAVLAMIVVITNVVIITMKAVNPEVEKLYNEDRFSF